MLSRLQCGQFSACEGSFLYWHFAPIVEWLIQLNDGIGLFMDSPEWTTDPVLFSDSARTVENFETPIYTPLIVTPARDKQSCEQIFFGFRALDNLRWVRRGLT